MNPATVIEKKIVSLVDRREKKELRKKFKEDQKFLAKTGQKRQAMNALNPISE
jgi:hypothetical protein